MHALEKMIVYYNHCRDNDVYKATIEHILKNLDKIRSATIYDLAEICYTSPTTISRLSRKMGYSGFGAFKSSISDCVRNYDAYNQMLPVKIRGDGVDTRSQFFEIVHEMVDVINRALDPEQTKRITDMIQKSVKISFYTCGSEGLERNFQEMLIVAGKESVIRMLPEWQKEDAKTLKPDCLVICLMPVTPESGDSLEVLEIAADKGAGILLITDARDNPARRYATEYLWFDGAMAGMDNLGFSMILTMLMDETRKRLMGT